MSKIGVFQPADKEKNYLLPPSKKSHSFHEETEKPLVNIIYKKLKKVTELLESLYYNLADDSGNHIKSAVGDNLKLLIKDLELMHNELKKTPFAFNTTKRNKNQHCIHEMQGACESLQKLSPKDIEVKQLAKIKHALHELDELIASKGVEPKAKEAPVKRVKKIEKL